MSPTSLLHKIIFRVTTTITPIVLILLSMVINLPNAELHKRTLRNSNFYNDLSLELRGEKANGQEINRSFSQILITAAIDGLATPGWLQNLFEQNINLLTTWLDNPEAELALYLPAKEIESSVAQNINTKTEEISRNFNDQIPECSREEDERIKREGFDLRNELCLPASVKNGEKSLTDFLGINQQTEERSEVLDTLIRNNAVNTFSNTFQAERILSTNQAQIAILNQANGLKASFLWLKSLIPVFFAIMAVLAVLDLILARINNKQLGREARRLFFFISTGSITLGLIIILVFGGFTYVSGWLQDLLIPSLGASSIVRLMTWEIVKFSFNLISIAIWTSLILLGVNLGLYLLEAAGLTLSVSSKNAKLQTNYAIPDKNPTFDGQFHKHRIKNKNKFEEITNPKEDLFKAESYKKIDSEPIDLARINSLQESHSTDQMLEGYDQKKLNNLQDFQSTKLTQNLRQDNLTGNQRINAQFQQQSQKKPNQNPETDLNYHEQSQENLANKEFTANPILNQTYQNSENQAPINSNTDYSATTNFSQPKASESPPAKKMPGL